ncbi:MAG: hypothetical protein V2A73_08255, partial [Pseudomonadota bacterium]
VWDVASGRPRWRAPALLSSPSPTLLTHQGWIALDADADADADSEASTGARAQADAPAGVGMPSRGANPGVSETRPSWRRAIEERGAAASQSSSGDVVCLRSHDDRLELWDVRSDQLLVTREMPALERALAIPGACLALVQGHLWLISPEQARDILKDVSAMAWEGDAILTVAKDRVLVMDRSGIEKARFPAEAGVTAVGRVGDFLTLGFREGHIVLVPLDRLQPRPSFAFEDAPASPVVRLHAGPSGTLIAGFANGVLGLWNLQNGTMLDSTKLHGSIVHLLLAGNDLHAATELGGHVVVRLGVFSRDYCELLDDVWGTVPTVWEGGLPVVRPPPVNHRCRAAHALRRSARTLDPRRDLTGKVW